MSEKKKAEVIDLEEKRKETKFTVQQRLTLMNMIPSKGGYFNIKKMRIVREELGLSDLEQEMFEKMTMLIPGGTVTDCKRVNTEIPLKVVDTGEWLADKFRIELKKQFDAEEIRDETVDLYDIFCGVPKKD